MFIPTPATFLWVVKKFHLRYWRGLTVSRIYKNLAKSIATSVGHLRHQQKNIKTTKQTESTNNLAESLDVSPNHEPYNTCTDTMYARMSSTSDKGKTYSNQTVKLPLQSSRGHNYVFILYDYDYNAIMSVALKYLQAKSIVDTLQHFFDQLKDNGYTPELHIINNECSDLFKNSFQNITLASNVLPSHSNRQNLSEHAIQTWKHNLISGISTCDTDLHPAEWYHLMHQWDITINLLRYSQHQPNSPHTPVYTETSTSIVAL